MNLISQDFFKSFNLLLIVENVRIMNQTNEKAKQAPPIHDNVSYKESLES